eukprot:650729-Pelagomonas_calceolata.AAC.1
MNQLEAPKEEHCYLRNDLSRTSAQVTPPTISLGVGGDLHPSHFGASERKSYASGSHLKRHHIKEGPTPTATRARTRNPPPPGRGR